MTHAYIRISSTDQNPDRQIDQMQADAVYIDRQSGKDFDRPEYQRMINALKQGDTVIITSIDRLGRNYDGIIDQWKHITKTIGADIVVLDMPMLDTRQGKDLMGTLISDLVLQIMSFVAQTEREHIRQRQAEGIAAAKARGKHLGRPNTEGAKFDRDIAEKVKNGLMCRTDAARLCDMSYSTFVYYYNKVIY